MPIRVPNEEKKEQRKSLTMQSRLWEYVDKENIDLNKFVIMHLESDAKLKRKFEFLRKLPRLNKGLAQFFKQSSIPKIEKVSQTDEIWKCSPNLDIDIKYLPQIKHEFKLSAGEVFDWKRFIDDLKEGKSPNAKEYKDLSKAGIIEPPENELVIDRIFIIDGRTGKFLELIKIQFDNSPYVYDLILDKSSQAYRDELERRKNQTEFLSSTQTRHPFKIYRSKEELEDEVLMKKAEKEALKELAKRKFNELKAKQKQENEQSK
jgi:hypothetical protein